MRWISIVVFAVAGVAQAQTGSINGTVKDDSGAPVPAAVVTAAMKTIAPSASMPSGRPGFLPFTPKAPSDSTGAFEIDGVVAGTYTMCVWVPEAAFLDPCLWNSKPVVVSVGSGATVGNVAVVAAKGVFVSIRVQDVSGLLTANPAKDDLRIGTVSSGSPFIPALVTERDGQGKTVAVVAPPGTPLSISVASTAFALTDSNGNALAASGATFPVTSSAVLTTGGTPSLTVQVVGPSAAKP
jgi:hypothetical protein